LFLNRKQNQTYFDAEEIAVGRRTSAGRKKTEVVVDSRLSVLSIGNRSSAFNILRVRSFFLVTFFGFLNCSLKKKQKIYSIR